MSDDTPNDQLLFGVIDREADSVADALAHGADVNWQNGAGMTTLCMAANTGPVAVVKHLIGAGADVNLLDKVCLLF